MSTAARARQEPRRLEFAASEIANLPGVETRTYRAGEVLLPTERLRQLDVFVRAGAIGIGAFGSPRRRTRAEVSRR